MTYKALDIAKKLIFKAQNDEPNGGERLTNLKLQKLLYYQQGYHLAAFVTPLFSENVEAWRVQGQRICPMPIRWQTASFVCPCTMR